jgi:hypothetical protein
MAVWFAGHSAGRLPVIHRVIHRVCMVPYGVPCPMACHALWRAMPYGVPDCRTAGLPDCPSVDLPAFIRVNDF